jgi:hypothetical protein
MSETLRPKHAPIPVVDTCLDDSQGINGFRGARNSPMEVIELMYPHVNVQTFSLSNRVPKSHTEVLREFQNAHREVFQDEFGSLDLIYSSALAIEGVHIVWILPLPINHHNT